MVDNCNLSEAKFLILKHIAEEENSSTELATKLGFSVPYIHQQLVLLEAQGYVKKRIIRTNSAGKPKTYYRISQDMVDVRILKEGYATQFRLSKTDQITTYLQILSLMNNNTHYLMSKFYWSNIDEMNALLSLAYISVDDEKIELFGIALTKDCEALRRKISNVKLVDEKGGHKTIVCWINSIDECEEGISKKDSYYLSHITRAKPLVDKDGLFSKLKEWI